MQGICQIRLNPVRNGIERLTLDAVKPPSSDRAGRRACPSRLTMTVSKFRSRFQPTTAGKPIVIEVQYRVEQPQRGLYFIGPSADYPQKPIQVWTQGEDEDSRYWFPCFDYPGQLATSEIRVRVPKQYLAISNGELVVN